jgi:mono/diheme cytochrome c family protein
MKAGAAIYADECSACHTPNGAGIPNLFPKLAGAAAVQSVDPTSLIRVVLAGTQSVATDRAPTAPAMPAFGWVLDDRQAAAVVTYIRNAWGNAAAAITPAEVADKRGNLTKRSD